MKPDFDLAIVGSGFGGSLLAMVARRLGLHVVLLERGSHPRFAVGESTSPLANLLLEELALKYDLPRLLPLTTYGAWRRAYPEIGCGLKRGFTFYSHEANKPYSAQPDRANQLMVAASPNSDIADTHWLRADVDEFLMREAVSVGAEYVDMVEITGVDGLGSGCATLTGLRHATPFRTSARFVVDATGPRGLLSRILKLPESQFAGYPQTQALFSHFSGVARCDEMPTFQSEGAPPYPADDAALHHVFDGGWMWVLRVGKGVVSAGFACTDAFARSIDLQEGAAAWPRFLQRFPSIGEQFAHAELLRPFIYSPRVTYRSEVMTGDGWALLPSAAAFIDPLFSTGMPLTLLGIARLGEIFQRYWGTSEMAAQLQDYAQTTQQEADWTAHYIGACYRAMARFPIFAPLSLFYFTAASYSELARRVQSTPSIRRYLAADHAEFASGLRRCVALLDKADPAALDPNLFESEISRAIACLNIAGLSDSKKQNWYGVDWEDVIGSAAKLGFTPPEMRGIIETAPWAKSAA